MTDLEITADGGVKQPPEPGETDRRSNVGPWGLHRRTRVLGVAAGVLAAGVLGAQMAISGFLSEEGTTVSTSRPAEPAEGVTTTTTAPAPASPTTIPRGESSTTTSTVPSTTVTRPPAVFVNGVPQVTTTPGRGPVGTVVTIQGYGFTETHWRATEASLWLAGTAPGCNLFAATQHNVDVTPEGFLSGTFIVPESGNCRQSTVTNQPLEPGRFKIVFQCSACTIGEFEVTVSEDQPKRCSDVGFSPNSDNLASDVMAYGLSCEEAHAVIRKAGPSTGPVNGASRLTVEGFECVRTGQDLSALPEASYECSTGRRRITFTRT